MDAHHQHLARRLGVLTAAAALVAGGLAVSTPATAATLTTTVDDATMRGADHFAYTGSWLTCSHCRSDSYGGSFHYTGRPGATVRLTFTGTRAVIYGVRQRSGGLVTVTVDGRAAAVVSLAASGTSIAPIYTTPALRPATHTVTLTVSARTAGQGHTVGIDRAVVTATTVTPPSPPGAPAPVRQAGAVASLSFDDGQLGQFQNAEPLLRAAGVHATFYVISDGMGWGPPQMSAPQVAQLAAAGEEIGDHTRDHADLTGLSAAQVEAEFADAQAAFRSQVGVTPTTCAYPSGAVDATVEQIAAKYFTACRGTAGGTNGAGADRYDLTVFYVHSSTTVADVQAAVASAQADGSWIIFVHHGIGTGGTADDVTTAQFAAELTAIRATGIPIRTVAQAMAGRG